MKSTNRPAGLARILTPLAALTLAAAAFAPTSAFGSTAAGTTIQNTASVSFNDGGGNPQTAVTASVSITILLVPSAPNVLAPAAQSIAQGQSASLTYFVTGTANGFDSYTASLGDTLTTLAGVTLPILPNILLGGTTLAAPLVSGTSSISVPWDSPQTSGPLNGLVGGSSGSVISIGGVVYTISTIDRSASTLTNNVAIINLTTTLTPVTALAVGLVIGEQKQVTVSIPSGNVTGVGSTGTDALILTVASINGAKPSTNSGSTVITVNRPTLTVIKTVSTDGGANFTASANAAPGVILTYRIVATNGGTSPAQAVIFTDLIPQYLTYVVNSGRYATAPAATYAAGTPVADSAGGYTFSSNTVTYNPGALAPTGTVAGGGSLVLFFQAKIN